MPQPTPRRRPQPVVLGPRGMPAAQGLYDPSTERDACGFGFICNFKNAASHGIVDKALTMLENMEHRGACGCEADSGDGAGILTATPDKFFRKAAKALNIALPPAGKYAVGMVFLPKDLVARRECEKILERTIEQYEMKVLGWRDVPVDSSACGPTPRLQEPRIRQLFVGIGERFYNTADFNRRLYLIRQQVENEIELRAAHPASRQTFYVNLLSTNRMCYKGMLTADQLRRYYKDLADPDFETPYAVVHSRFSTNTFPSWRLAHPYRYLAHNGEINTLRGNRNWMKARYGSLHSDVFGDELAKLFPILSESTSDSATLDNTLQFLSVNGRSTPHAMMMLMPAAWQNDSLMDADLRAFHEYHACLMEPWDGPAGVAFTDGTVLGATLDRNGLRPARYYVTRDDLVIMASEAGVLPVPPEQIVRKRRLQPGRMLLIDLEKKRIVDDAKLKRQIVGRRPWRDWLDEHMLALESLPDAPGYEADVEGEAKGTAGETGGRTFTYAYTPGGARSVRSAGDDGQVPAILKLQHAFGYTNEDLRLLMYPMAAAGAEAVGSMGADTPLACLSDRPQTLFNYFKQLFAQVTNPPLDALREELVTSLDTYLGREGNLLSEEPENCRLVKLKTPVVTNRELAKLRALDAEGFRNATVGTLFNVADGPEGLAKAVERVCADAEAAVRNGATLLTLTDRGVDQQHAPIPALLATAAVHHHLIRAGIRTQAGLMVETGEVREAHHFCCLLGYGAGAVNPYLALDTIADLHADGFFSPELDVATLQKQYVKAANKGVLKVASKMGISTVQSYRGAQIFEAVGVGREVIDQHFTGTASRIGGVTMEVLGQEALLRHRRAFPRVEVQTDDVLDAGGFYQWRRDGEFHQWNPTTVAKLQAAVRTGVGGSPTEGAPHPAKYIAHTSSSDGAHASDTKGAASYADGNGFKLFREFTRACDDESRQRCTIRGLLQFVPSEPVPLEEVEPASALVKRFATGAMSFGSISAEAHETLAIAMNRLGGKSNSGEGGEDSRRFKRDDNGDWRRSAIKQVASGRFGVTSEYLVNAEQLQIKVAQGAKPGEGGQLPGHKVDEHIARVRHSTPGVGLISPPPHHDIYSIEDLAQLIHDLKSVNPAGEVSVKLVSEVGVGTVAAGVAKAKADHILISGDGGGTGASPLTSIKHCGLPWELGLAETQQVLLMNGLRGRVRVQADGSMKTGRDAVIAGLLGAEEVGFSTAPLIAVGCVMMRVCHLNTCPVGIATQDPELRGRFAGVPEHVTNFMFFVAEEARGYMAQLGFRTWDEMVGRVDKLDFDPAVRTHWKARHLDLDAVLHQPTPLKGDTTRRTQAQDHGLKNALDVKLIELAKPALERGEKVSADVDVLNVNRTVGAMLSGEVAKRHGFAGLPDDTIKFKFAGSAGQSFGAFLTRGITLELEGEANDYVGKGLSGGRVIVYPPAKSKFRAEENIIAGNVIGYGAIAGELYLRGVVGERFCVRNSGATAVVEGCGDHGCEYMTGGRVAVLGPVGRNFAAGMSGGIAYVYDHLGQLPRLCNLEMVELGPVEDDEDVSALREVVERHAALTRSERARAILDDWAGQLAYFVRVMPSDYRRVLEARRAQAREVAVA